VILISLGANLDSPAGPPRATIAAAEGALAIREIRLLKASPSYRSPAWPDPSDPPFTNAVALVRTTLDPAALLAVLHAVEAEFGRVRSRPNAPRTLDLDLIDYDGRVEEGPPILPHPRAKDRAFVLKPLADVAPDWIHPATRQSVATLLAALPPSDVAAVVKMST